MYFNNALTQVKKSQRLKDTYGYYKDEFLITNKKYRADVQPYNSELLLKQYGISENLIKYRCFLKDKGLKIGDYVSLNNTIYLINYLEEWESHVEIILKEVMSERNKNI